MKRIIPVLLSMCVISSSNAESVTSNLCNDSLCPERISGENYIVDHGIYIADVDCRTRLSSWVAYKVSKDNLLGPQRERLWKTDDTLPLKCTMQPSDYKGAYDAFHYERGHMAPIGSFTNSTLWEKTNILTNIEPQSKGLNEGPWAALEMHVRALSLMYGSVYVISGPLYLFDMNALPSNDKVVVPSAFFKIVVSKYYIDAYLIPQAVAFYEDFNNFKVSVQDIETLTGLKFNIGSIKDV